MPDNLQMERPLDNQPTVSALVGGIVNDAQQLIRQEVALAKREIKDELSKAKTAAVSAGICVGFLAVGGLLLAHMVALLITWAGNWPAWVGYLITGAVVLITGAVLLFLAKNQASKIDVVPRQTVETMKENVQWIKTQT